MVIVQNIVLRYFKNTSWLLLEQMLRIFAALLIGIWVARYLGPKQFGLLSYVIAFTSIIGGFSKLGLDKIMVRELVNNPREKDEYLGTGFWLKAAASVLMLVLITFILYALYGGTDENICIFVVAAGLVFNSFEVIEFYFLSKVLAKFISICKIIQISISCTIKSCLIVAGADLIWFAFAVAFDSFSLAVAYFFSYRLSNNPPFYKCFKFRIAKRLIKSSWPLILSSMMVVIYIRIDQIMIKEMLGDEEVGLYSAAARVIDVMILPIVILNNSISPYFLNTKITNEYLRYEIISQFSYISGIAIVSVGFLFSNFFYSNLFGPDFVKSADYFNLLLVSLMFVYLSIPFSNFFIKNDFIIFQMVVVFVSVVVNIISNFIMIPIYGVAGAIYATILARAFTSVSMYFVDKNLFYIQLRTIFFMNVRRLIRV